MIRIFEMEEPRMKKLLACLLPLCLLAAMLCGCTSTGETPSAAPAAAPESSLPVPESTEAPAATEPVVEVPEDLHPMLFRVTGEGGQEMYLFGTIHVGDERNAAALSLIAPTLDECDALAVEFDVLASGPFFKESSCRSCMLCLLIGKIYPENALNSM